MLIQVATDEPLLLQTSHMYNNNVVFNVYTESVQ